MNLKFFLIPLGILAVAVSVIFTVWLFIVFSKDPLQNPVSKLPLPVVCTLKGCITAKSWLSHHKLEEDFAKALQEDIPTTTDTLTTLTRQHLTKKTFLKSPVTRSEAKRYREEILNLKTEEQLKEVINLSLQEYDKKIVMPWLEQEALRQEYNVETIAELYSAISRDKFIVVWPLNLTWDKNRGEVIKR